jgi:hypothetical protein
MTKHNEENCECPCHSGIITLNENEYWDTERKVVVNNQPCRHAPFLWLVAVVLALGLGLAGGYSYFNLTGHCGQSCQCSEGK